MKYAIVTIVIIIAVAIFGTQSMYTQDETQLSVVTRFGQIKVVETSPGLKFKIPFVDSKTYFDKRLLRVDLPPASLPDTDTQFLIIDAYVRYQIGHNENGNVSVAGGDVENFFETLQTLTRADDRIARIVASQLRDAVANRKRAEIIGANVRKVVTVVRDPATEISLEDAILVRLDSLIGDDITEPTVTREEMLSEVLAKAEQDVQEQNLGVTIRDVRIKRADFPPEAQQSIFTRMRAERERLARGFRAEGQKERDTIEAEVDLAVAVILAEAERDANRTRGDGEAQAISILAESLGEDPEFFAFRRSLEAYQKFLSQNSTIILSAESDLFQYLEEPHPNPVPPP